jgi:predicted GIY-YIG superfamily endonuclease
MAPGAGRFSTSEPSCGISTRNPSKPPSNASGLETYGNNMARVKLVFKKQIGKRGPALKIERPIKWFPRHKKEQLINTATGKGGIYEWIQGI